MKIHHYEADFHGIACCLQCPVKIITPRQTYPVFLAITAIVTCLRLNAAYVTAYVLLRNLYPYSRYVPHYTTMGGVVTTSDRHF